MGLHQEYRAIVGIQVGLVQLGIWTFAPTFGWVQATAPEVTPSLLALGLGALADCPWLGLRKTLSRPQAVGVLVAQGVLPLAVAGWVAVGAERLGGVILVANALVVAFNLIISHLWDHLPPR